MRLLVWPLLVTRCYLLALALLMVSCGGSGALSSSSGEPRTGGMADADAGGGGVESAAVVARDPAASRILLMNKFKVVSVATFDSPVYDCSNTCDAADTCSPCVHCESDIRITWNTTGTPYESDCSKVSLYLYQAASSDGADLTYITSIVEAIPNQLPLGGYTYTTAGSQCAGEYYTIYATCLDGSGTLKHSDYSDWFVVMGTPTLTPTATPSSHPTLVPTPAPTSPPTGNPSSAPTLVPTPAPTSPPTLAPSAHPTLAPTAHPTLAPTGNPSRPPTLAPTAHPTLVPTSMPIATTPPPTLNAIQNASTDLNLVVCHEMVTVTWRPTGTAISDCDTVDIYLYYSNNWNNPVSTTPLTSNHPNGAPTASYGWTTGSDNCDTSYRFQVFCSASTKVFSNAFYVGGAPTTPPTSGPTGLPTLVPTSLPTLGPTLVPTALPSLAPTAAPSLRPTLLPTAAPSLLPTLLPTLAPSHLPTLLPTLAPTLEPSSEPTGLPSFAPTLNPSSAPTALPSLAPTSLPSLAPTSLPSSPPSLAPTGLPSLLPTHEPTSAAATDWVLADRDMLNGPSGNLSLAITCGNYRNLDGAIDCLVGDASGTVMSYSTCTSSCSDTTCASDKSDWNFKKNSDLKRMPQQYAAPFCTDMDGDDIADCFVGKSDGKVNYYSNTGTEQEYSGPYYPFCGSDLAASTQISEGFNVDYFSDVFNVGGDTQKHDGYASPFCADFDFDGNIDCLVGVDQSDNKKSNVHYFSNSGSEFTWETDDFFDCVDESDAKTYSKPFCLDFDGDGDLDCMVGTANGDVKYVRNDGDKTQWQWTCVSDNVFDYDFGSYSSPYCSKVFATSPSSTDDTDYDSTLVCFIANAEGYVFRFMGLNGISAPSFAPTALPTGVPTLDPTLLPSGSPTLVPTALPSLEPTAQPTLTPTLDPTLEPSGLPTMQPTLVPTALPTLDPTALPTHDPTLDPSAPPTLDPTHEPTALPTLAPTLEPTLEPTALPTLAPTLEPTLEPTAPPTKFGPTALPTLEPTLEPTALPTLDPTLEPTPEPSSAPTALPSHAPTLEPSSAPTSPPTFAPTPEPTASPTLAPTALPSLAPTSMPSLAPTLEPTLDPTALPTLDPTLDPSALPTLDPTLEPTALPTLDPTLAPTAFPTLTPTLSPTALPSLVPTLNPSAEPTLEPTALPTSEPTTQPTLVPTSLPTLAPTLDPTALPSLEPTLDPTLEPTSLPTLGPTAMPTLSPSAAPTALPTPVPTPEPTLVPTPVPSPLPTLFPSPLPSLAPTGVPSSEPSPLPTLSHHPTAAPTPVPSRMPTLGPTRSTCRNGLLDSNWGETDTDCGGTNCAKCENGKNCKRGKDCETGNCAYEGMAGTCRFGKYCVCVAGYPTPAPTYAPPELDGITVDGVTNFTEVDGTEKVVVVPALSSNDAVLSFAWHLRKNGVRNGGGPGTAAMGVDLVHGTTTVTPVDNEYLVLKANVLQPGAAYTFRLTVTNSHGASSAAILNVTAGRPPRHGALWVSPKTGICFRTSFFLQAYNWTDDASSLPLTYTFVHNSKADGRGIRTALQPGSTKFNNITTSALPLGNAEDGSFELQVGVVVTDVWGLEGTVGQVIVVSPPTSLESAATLASNQTGLISGLLDVEDARNVQSALTYLKSGASVIHYVLNATTKTAVSSQAVAARSSYLTLVEKALVERSEFVEEAIESVEATALTLNFLTSAWPELLTRTEQQNVMHHVDHIVNITSAIGETSETVSDSSVTILSSIVSGGLIANAGSGDAADRNADSVMTILLTLGSNLAEPLSPGEDATSVAAPELAVTTQVLSDVLLSSSSGHTLVSARASSLPPSVAQPTFDLPPDLLSTAVRTKSNRRSSSSRRRRRLFASAAVDDDGVIGSGISIVVVHWATSPFTDRGPFHDPFKLDNFTSATTLSIDGVKAFTKSYSVKLPLPLTTVVPHYLTERHNLTCDRHPDDDFLTAFDDDLTDIDLERASFCGYDVHDTHREFDELPRFDVNYNLRNKTVYCASNGLDYALKCQNTSELIEFTCPVQYASALCKRWDAKGSNYTSDGCIFSGADFDAGVVTCNCSSASTTYLTQLSSSMTDAATTYRDLNLNALPVIDLERSRWHLYLLLALTWLIYFLFGHSAVLVLRKNAVMVMASLYRDGSIQEMLAEGRRHKHQRELEGLSKQYAELSNAVQAHEERMKNYESLFGGDSDDEDEQRKKEAEAEALRRLGPKSRARRQSTIMLVQEELNMKREIKMKDFDELYDYLIARMGNLEKTTKNWAHALWRENELVFLLCPWRWFKAEAMMHGTQLLLKVLTFAVLACLSADKRYWCGGIDPSGQGDLYLKSESEDDKTAAYYEDSSSKGRSGVLYDDPGGDRGIFYASKAETVDYMPTFQLHGFFAFPNLVYIAEHEGQGRAFDAYATFVQRNFAAFVVASLWCLPMIALSSFAYTWRRLLEETDTLNQDRLLQEEDLRILEPASVENRKDALISQSILETLRCILHSQQRLLGRLRPAPHVRELFADEDAMPLSDEVLSSARHVMALNVSLVETVKVDLAARVGHLIHEDDRRDRHRYRINVAQRRYFWTRWWYMFEHRWKRDADLTNLAHDVRISLLPDELQLKVYEHRQILATFVRRGGVLGCNPMTWLKARMYKIYVVDQVGACKYEIGKEKHGLSPWQLRLAADAIQSFALLYMVIATAGTIWYAVMVKDNYLVNCVLYTAITNTIMSIVVTGPLYNLFMDGIVPAVASWLVRTDVLRYLQEEELNNVDREETDSGSDSDTDAAGAAEANALESGTSQVTIVAAQTNPMLLVGAGGFALHTAADLDGLNEEDRLQVMSRMEPEERDAVRERDTRKTLASLAEAVHTAMRLGLADDEMFEDLQTALALGWKMSSASDGDAGSAPSVSCLGLEVTPDVEVAMMLLAEYDSRATFNESAAYQFALRQREVRHLSLGLQEATSGRQRQPVVLDADVRALVSPDAFHATRYREATDRGRVRRASLADPGPGLHARLAESLTELPWRESLHRRPSFSHPHSPGGGVASARSPGIAGSLNVAELALLPSGLEEAASPVERDIETITWEIKEYLHTEDYPVDAEYPEDIVADAVYRLELEDIGDFHANMHAVAGQLGVITTEHSSAAGRALSYFRQPHQLVPYAPHQPDKEMQSAVGRSAVRVRRERRRQTVRNGEHDDPDVAMVQAEQQGALEERELEKLRHEAHHRHSRRHSIAAPERTAAHLALWSRHHQLVAALRRNPGPPSRPGGLGELSSVRTHRSGARSADPFLHVATRAHHSHDAPLHMPPADTPRHALEWHEDSVEILQAAEASGIPVRPLPRRPAPTDLARSADDVWEEHFDDDGTQYFQHKDTGEMVWEKPVPADDQAGSDGEGGGDVEEEHWHGEDEEEHWQEGADDEEEHWQEGADDEEEHWHDY